MFLGYYEKRLKLQLLRAELVPLTNLHGRMGLSRDENNLYQSHLPAVELRVIETVVSDTYSITHTYRELLSGLAELRQEVRSLNSLTEILRLQIAVSPGTGANRVRVYGQTLNHRVTRIEQLAREAITEVEKIIGSA